MLNFPEWSDLGNVSNEMRMAWEQEIQLRERYRYYYDGLIFQEKVPVEAGADEAEAPLLYPVGINLVKMLCLAQTDSLFGEWEDQIVKFEVRQDDVPDAASEAATSLLGKIALGSELNSSLWEVELDRNVFGGGAFKVSPALKTPGFIQWSRVPLSSFFPVFDPDDPNQLLECFVLVQMTPEQARLKNGYTYNLIKASKGLSSDTGRPSASTLLTARCSCIVSCILACSFLSRQVRNASGFYARSREKADSSASLQSVQLEEQIPRVVMGPQYCWCTIRSMAGIVSFPRFSLGTIWQSAG